MSFSNSRDKIGRTALHHAAWKDKDDLVRFLMWESQQASNPLESQLGTVAKINAADVDGHTPLHLASRKGCRKVVKELLGRKPWVEVSYKQTLKRESKAKASLKKFFAKENYIEPNSAANPTPGRSLNIVKGIEKTLKKLADYRDERGIQLPRPKMKNSIWLEERAGITALHYAVESANEDVVGFLVTHWKTSVFQQASNAQSPWSIVFPARWNNPQASPFTETQLLLKGDAEAGFWSRVAMSEKDRKISRQMHQRKLLKQARALALAAEQNFELWDNLHDLEHHIFFTFETALAHDSNYRPFIPSEMQDTLENWAHKYEQNASTSHFNLNLLHVAAYYGCGQELEALLNLKTYKDYVNEYETFTTRHQTPLHFAMDGGPAVVSVLLKENTLNLTNRYRYSNGFIPSPETMKDVSQKRDDLGKNPTLFDLVNRKGGLDQQIWLDSIGLDQQFWMSLIETTKKLLGADDYRDRQVYIDAANAILVGAALIAGVTFAGFLQPPLGYVPYYTEFFPDPAPPSMPESFAAVGGHLSVRVFWVFNSLSYFAIATVLAGAGAALPTSDNLEKEVRIVRNWLKVTASLLAISIICVLVAFTAAGSASLPNIAKYQFNFIWTAVLGLVVCLLTLCAFYYRLFKLSVRKAIWTIFFLSVTIEAGIALYYLCRPLLHRIANDRGKYN